MSQVKWLLVFVFACGGVPEPSDIVGPEDLADVAEAYCQAHPELPCGHVFECDTPSENPLGRVEFCVLDTMGTASVESLFGSCRRSTDPRFLKANSWLCWHCCGEGCGAGCNAYSGCFCPTPEPLPDAGVDAYVNDMPPTSP